MSDRKATIVFVFFFVIPYLAGQAMIGIAYNSLVLHNTSIWRTIVGAGVGALILYAAKVPMERPLRILGKYTYVPFIHLSVRFFMLQEARPLKIVLNYLFDFLGAVVATGFARFLWPGQVGHAFLVGTPFGWCIAIMFVSLCIGAYIDFDALSIANPKLVNPPTRPEK